MCFVLYTPSALTFFCLLLEEEDTTLAVHARPATHTYARNPYERSLPVLSGERACCFLLRTSCVSSLQAVGRYGTCMFRGVIDRSFFEIKHFGTIDRWIERPCCLLYETRFSLFIGTFNVPPPPVTARSVRFGWSVLFGWAVILVGWAVGPLRLCDFLARAVFQGRNAGWVGGGRKTIVTVSVWKRSPNIFPRRGG